MIQEQAQAQEQIDDLLNDLERELDDDFDLGGFRERRMQELRSEYAFHSLSLTHFIH